MADPSNTPRSEEPDDGLPRIKGRWLILFILIWPVLAYAVFVFFTRLMPIEAW